MRSSRHDQVPDAARRRLELLRDQLQQQAPAQTEEPPPRALEPAGRHLSRSVSRTTLTCGWLNDRMPSALRGRVRLGGREFAALALLVGVALALAGWTALRSGAATPVRPAVAVPASSAAPLATPAASAAAAAAGASDASPVGATAAATAAPAGEVVVDVTGKVRRPGVVTLPSGSRVVDALRRAGGARRGVDLSGINLARVLTDGEQVVVGAPAAPAGAPAVTSPGGGAGGGLVSLNTATMEQLDSLPGVGPVTAQKILAWRESNGAFSDVNELLEIDGIGEKTLSELAPLVTL